MKEHFVTLIRDDQNGKTLFWHRTETADTSAEAIDLWGKPVGFCFGTSLEIWFVTPDGAQLFYPVFAPPSTQPLAPRTTP